MKLNLFVAWSAFALALIGVITIAFTLVAAGSGHSGFALASGVAAAVAVMLAVGMVAGTVRRDHHRHIETPHLF
ncbi:hypothetical protein EV641_105226 [Rhodococcus sp. SMB37]|uniref:hypothetical protein n=1 Tax=Rhodococcus sp. SMB37 TaxID=2512213 RepID=UPI0006CFAEAB|nr:hypothetical protein [Rhodococcus sp. SMB37]TCN54201.1 hypothetical protein EV641_105226 [Rhodococcus sp. SMB37]